MKYLALLAIVAFVGAWQFGYLAPYGLTPFLSGYQTPPPDEDIEVFCKITTRILISSATSDLIVNMYDASGEFLDTVTTSSGVGTFTGLYNPGAHVWLQARQAAPASADPYVTPLSEWVVPLAGESADTVALRNVLTGESILWLRDVTSTAPTLVVRNGWNNATVSSTVQQFNTTDNQFTISLTLSVANTYYGAEDYTDMKTGRQYDGGIFFMWKGTSGTQSWDQTPKYTFADMTNVWYVWEVSAAGMYYDANDLTYAFVSYTVQVTSAQGTFNDDTGITLDVYDMLDLSQVGTSSMFVDGGAVAVTGVSTDCS